MSKNLHRFDHAAAMAYFIELDPGERSSRAVAEKFAVSERTIAKWRGLEGWDAAADEADRLAAEAVRNQAIQTREQRALQDARIRAKAATLVESRLEEGDVADDFVARVLADADKRVRLNEGDATDLVAVATVQAGFRESLAASNALHEALVRELVEDGVISEDVGLELVRRFRVELPGRVQERLALIEGGDAGA